VEETQGSNLRRSNTEFDPSPLHHTFLLGRARFIAQPFPTLLSIDHLHRVHVKKCASNYNYWNILQQVLISLILSSFLDVSGDVKKWLIPVLDELKQDTCVHFQPRSREQYYVEFVKGDGG